MKQGTWRTLRAGLVTSAAAACLSGCFVLPGQFDSELNIRKDGRFTFTYSGEIHILAMSQLSEMASAADGEEETFSPTPCFDEETFEDRDCTGEERATQQEEWEANAPARAAEEAQGRAMMMAMMGGLDTSDPEMAAEFAESLEKQAGWNTVTYSGDGTFEVDYSIASRIGHDFVFPVIDKIAVSSAFVTASLRDGDRVRVEATGFVPASGAGAFQGLMVAGMMNPGATESGGEEPAMPQAEGQFRIVTDARILANNTEEGPVDGAQGQTLTWDIGPRSSAAPTALLELTP